MAVKTIFKKIVASPGEEDYIVAYTVQAAKRYKLNKVTVWFPIGTHDELELEIYKGIEKVLPSGDPYSGDGIVIVDEVEETFHSGSEIRILYKNLSDTEIRKAYILLKGELE